MSRVVIVPCSAAKRDRPAPAGVMYLSQYHRACRAAADALVAAAGGGRVLILSAEYGLLELGDLIAPYDRKMGDPGSVSVETLRAQAARLGVLDATDVVALGGKKYVDAVAAVRPDVLRPLDGTRGIGDHLRRLDQLARGERQLWEYLPPGTRPAAVAGEAAEVEHREVAGWGGVQGECGVSCACGTTFDGFDTLADAHTMLAVHISQETTAAALATVNRGGRPRRPGGPKPKQSVRVDGGVWALAQQEAERRGVKFADVVEQLLVEWTREPSTAPAMPVDRAAARQDAATRARQLTRAASYMGRRLADSSFRAGVWSASPERAAKEDRAASRRHTAMMRLTDAAVETIITELR
ncbi:DUF6884 domain-containing protein [Micromonospora tulbaghiae]|uniref:DUF6884 domain-containing protein n=1 Tax=Micromonospora tulbaghiae TaxID=479978 RepID=UPI0037161778